VEENVVALCSNPDHFDEDGFTDLEKSIYQQGCGHCKKTPPLSATCHL